MLAKAADCEMGPFMGLCFARGGFEKDDKREARAKLGAAELLPFVSCFLGSDVFALSFGSYSPHVSVLMGIWSEGLAHSQEDDGWSKARE